MRQFHPSPQRHLPQMRHLRVNDGMQLNRRLIYSMFDQISSTRHAAPDHEKTHYNPAFYLKPWAGPDNKVCEFSRPYKEVNALRKHPKATGFEEDLYAIHDLPPDRRHMLERDFMKPLDQYAYNVLKVLLADGELNLTVKERDAWSRFILSLFQRTPERVAWLCENFDRMRRNDLATLENFRSSISGAGDLQLSKTFESPFRPAPDLLRRLSSFKQ